MKNKKKNYKVDVFYQRKFNGGFDAMVVERKTARVVIPMQNEWIVKDEIKSLKLHVVNSYYFFN